MIKINSIKNKDTGCSIATIGLLFVCNLMFAQRNTVASGGEATGSGGTVSYTVGQIDYISSTGSSGSVNQGVQQPYEFFTVGIDKYPDIQAEAIVYPNPTIHSVRLIIKNTNLKNLTYQLFDARGRKLSGQQINSNVTQIDMYHLAPATYFLRVYGASSIFKTFKIIKHNTN